jgi:hypothetical protein
VARVVIGVDPHKRSATIEIMNHREKAIGKGRFGTDRDGYQAMLAAGRKHTDRIWAVEGCSGIGRHVAQRLVADGENVVDVPAKLSARARVFATGQGRKTDPVDAHSVAVAALRTDNLRQVTIDDTTVALRLLVDRRELLGRTRTETVSRLHHLLLELAPCRNSPVSDRPDPLVSWATSVTSAASPAADTSRPGTAPLPSTRRQATRTGTACPGPETGGSTGFCTSWPWSNSGATPKAAATTDENSPPARLRWKPCAL